LRKETKTSGGTMIRSSIYSGQNKQNNTAVKPGNSSKWKTHFI
jgi:hypothetical protein